MFETVTVGERKKNLKRCTIPMYVCCVSSLRDRNEHITSMSDLEKNDQENPTMSCFIIEFCTNAFDDEVRTEMSHKYTYARVHTHTHHAQVVTLFDFRSDVTLGDF